VCRIPGYPPFHAHVPAQRLALHSTTLHFTHPVTAKPMHFNSPLPPDLSQWLARVRLTSGLRGEGQREGPART
jgi:hypothetical protein